VVHGAAIDPHDAGFLHGHGVFETMGALAGDLPLWEHHLRRLAGGAARLGIACAPPAGLRERARDLLARNGHDVLRVTLTAGTAAPTWCMTTRARDLRPWVRLHAAREPRGADALATVKHVSRAAYVVALAEARERGADDALLLDGDGRVQETTTGNLLLCADGAWRTPLWRGSFLPGIARGLLLEALANTGRAARDVDVTLADLDAADEVYVTNAVYGPRPAARLGARAPSGDNALAPLWQAILERAAARKSGGPSCR
jgi:branched-subunit amino acid aminotransferase/4-amino-4-deoxychorismate lyase